MVVTFAVGSVAEGLCEGAAGLGGGGSGSFPAVRGGAGLAGLVSRQKKR